jgi:hypothetical protein
MSGAGIWRSGGTDLTLVALTNITTSWKLLYSFAIFNEKSTDSN